MSDPYYIPVEVLLSSVTFARDEFTGGVIAWTKIDYRQVGRCDGYIAGHPELLDKWKTDLFRGLRGLSSTCQLKTLCGCTKLVNVEGRRLSDYLVPINKLVPMYREQSDTHLSQSAACRLFRWRHRYSDLGFKILDEEG